MLPWHLLCAPLSSLDHMAMATKWFKVYLLPDLLFFSANIHKSIKTSGLFIKFLVFCKVVQNGCYVDSCDRFFHGLGSFEGFRVVILYTTYTPAAVFVDTVLFDL